MTEDLDFTGERHSPTIGGDIFLEYMRRYHLAKTFVKGKDVLDIGGGEGLGTAFLAESARSVIGVAISNNSGRLVEPMSHEGNISLRTGSSEEIPLPSASVDVVTVFKAFEHIGARDCLMLEMKRVLRADGMLLISINERSPETISRKSGLRYPEEWSNKEFGEFLLKYFAHVSVHKQTSSFGSTTSSEISNSQYVGADDTDGVTFDVCPNLRPLIGIASDRPLDDDSIREAFSQDIPKPEILLDRGNFDGAQWGEILMRDVDHISGQVDALQRNNWMSSASLVKLLKRLIYARLLYALSEMSIFSSRRRKRFLKSAEKRDPMLLSRKVDQFCLGYYERINSNKVIAASRSRTGSQSGMRVTAIVPNFNHARYLPQRLDSILAQTYPLIDILILDDNSSDDSRSVIQSYVERFPGRIKAVFNSENSGNVFRQWQKGHSLATGDLVWVCESDDFCEPTFVERMVNTFRDPSVMLAFGRIQFANSQGEYLAGLDHYREDAEPGIWEDCRIRPAAEWFQGGFGVKNVIANVGGSLWRRFEISDQVWEEARSFKIMGDWYLYSVIAGGGQIAYEPSAVSYFRIHESNTSGRSAQSKPEYYKEYAQLMTSLKKRWDIPDATLSLFIDVGKSVARGAGLSTQEFERLLNYENLRKVSHEQIHVLIGILGFSFGGGEIFPIHLANALRRKGIIVSILQMHGADDHQDVQLMLDPGIPIYTANFVRDIGVTNFVKKAGISVVHSHVANVEAFLLRRPGVSVPFISTLHGSYEAMNISTRRIARWSQKIDKFAYTADRNLRPFDNLQVNKDKFVKIKNAMPVDDLPFPRTRAQLGITNNAIVFAFVARGAEGKGWVEAVKAYRALRERRPEAQMALLMVGEGPAADDAERLATVDSTIHFFGFVKEIYGLYRISDVALIPTRFPGESYPLCLIQALQVGVPCVSTDVGEIKAMSQINGQEAGIIIPNDSDSSRFIGALSRAMEKMLETDVREKYRANAKVIGRGYDIDALAGEYIDHYRSVISD